MPAMADPATESEQSSDVLMHEYRGPDRCSEKILSPENEVILVESEVNGANEQLQVDFRRACARCHKVFLETKNNPKLLPCLHSLCDQCVVPVQDSQDTIQPDDQGAFYPCPQCDLNYAPQSLLDNMFIQDLLKDAKPEEGLDGEPIIHECTACEEKEMGTSFCINCSEWLCDQCVTAHKRVRVTKDHKIVPKGEAPNSDSSKSTEIFLYCKQHKQEKLSFYCEKCDILTCRDCQLVEHKDHRYQFLDVAGTNVRKTLLENKHQMSEHSKRLSQLRSKIEGKLTCVKLEHSKIVKEVQEQADTLIKQIILNARQLLQDVKVACEAMARKLASASNELYKTLGKFDHCINFVDELTDGGSNLALLMTKSIVLKEFSRVYSLPIDQQAVKPTFQVQYVHDNQFILSNLNRFGAIYVNNHRFSSANRNTNNGTVPPKQQQTYKQPGNNYVSAVDAAKKRQQHLMMSIQKAADHMASPHMQSLLSQNLPQSQPNPIPPQVSNLVSQMRVNSQPPSWPQSQGLGRANNQNVSMQQPHYSQPPPPPPPPPPQQQRLHQQQPFQPMRLQHRPASQQSVYNSSQHATVTPTMSTSRTSMSHHPQPPRGPPLLIPNVNQSVSPPVQQPVSNTATKQAKSDTALPSGVRIKQERGSCSENDCVIMAASVKGEPRTHASACSGNQTRQRSEKSPSPSTNGQSSNHGTSPASAPQPAHTGETEKNLEQVLDDLPIDELPSVEEINTHLMSSHNPNQPFDTISDQHSMLAPPSGKGSGGDICMSDPNEDYCAVCHNGGEVLCCDDCPRVFHLNCHIPPLNAVPNGVFVCTLCSTGDNMRISSPAPDEMNGNKRKAPSGLNDKQIKVCERIMLELFCNPNSAAFHQPVSKQVPNYYKIIKNPMDFKTIKTKLARTHFNHYNCIEDFLADVKLVFQNCATYNQDTSEVGKAGKIVRASFEELVARYLPPYLRFAATYPPRPQPNDPSVDPKRAKTDEIIRHIS